MGSHGERGAGAVARPLECASAAPRRTSTFGPAGLCDTSLGLRKESFNVALGGSGGEPVCASPRQSAPWPKKERKKTDNPREGCENGTPPPHRDFGAMRGVLDEAGLPLLVLQEGGYHMERIAAAASAFWTR